MTTSNDQTILFFDGYCGLCSGVVDFLIARDKKNRLLFSPLQGQTASELLAESDRTDLDSVVVTTRRGSTVTSYRKSDAILVALKTMGGFHAALSALGRAFPPFVRDSVYDFVAKNRFKIIARQAACRVPTPAERSRFLP